MKSKDIKKKGITKLTTPLILYLCMPMSLAWAATCTQDADGNYIGTNCNINFYDGNSDITIGSATEASTVYYNSGNSIDIASYNPSNTSSIVTVNSGSSLTIPSGYNTVGKWRDGSIIINNGQLHAGHLIIADDGPDVMAPSPTQAVTGIVTASGNQALIELGGDLTIANWNSTAANDFTEGILNLSDQAVLRFSQQSSGNTVTVGAGASANSRSGGGKGTINIDNASFDSMGRNLIVGRYEKAIGYINIDNNGVMTVSSAVIGNATGSSGYVNVLNGSQFIVGSTTAPSSINLAQSTDSTGMITIGAKDNTDSTNAQVGQVVGNIIFGQGNASLVFNHNASNYEFSNLLSGGVNAQVIQQGVGTTSLTNTANSYIGENIIRGGTLKINDDRVLGNKDNKIIFDTINGLTGTLYVTDQVSSDRDISMNADGIFKVDPNKVYTSNGDISGQGGITLTGSGTMSLNGTNTYNGTTNIINNSTLSAGIANTLSANSTHIVGSGSYLQLNGTNQTIQGLNNSGVVSLPGTLGDSAPFSTLTVLNNYVGQNGRFIINTQLDDDASLTDKIIINGNATGSTELQVNNFGGAGALTANGIHVIQTGTSEANTFYIENGGYIAAGAYDYGLNLKKAGTGTNTTTFDNWYLESHLRDDTPIYTPDIGSYLAAETMGNTLFTSRLEDREGASQYQNLGNKNEGNVWVRAYGGHNKFKTMDSQLKTTGNSFVTQIGAGLVTLGEEDQYNLGAMTGFAYYDGKTRSSLTDRESKTKIDGYSLGLYGTWYAHPVEKRGAYIDSWVLWNKFNNKIDTPDQNQYKYDSSGITASIEAGGDYLLNKNGQKDWWVQPQVQLIYQGVHADDFKDAQGVDVYHGKDNVQARMGVKTYLNITTNGNKLTSYRPYVALNFIHNTNPYSVVIDDIRYENEGSANLGEIKLGVEGQVTKNSQVWLNASYVAGSHSNQAYQGNIGWKYNF